MSFNWSKEIGAPSDLPFKEVLFDEKDAINKTSVRGAVVPFGEVWEINQLFLYTTVSADLQFRKVLLGDYPKRFEQKDSATWISWSGKIFLKENEGIMSFTSAAGNLYLRIYGVKRLSLESALASRKLRINLILPKEDIQEPDVVKDPLM